MTTDQCFPWLINFFCSGWEKEFLRREAELKYNQARKDAELDAKILAEENRKKWFIMKNNVDKQKPVVVFVVYENQDIVVYKFWVSTNMSKGLADESSTTGKDLFYQIYTNCPPPMEIGL